ncbi:polyprenyl synthetase family protein [Vitreimonas flagellata]|uniref:polyprenyl synthetase family protein n=1 Tax=Vitreimonas flagellata TaxID=2560861 RepID=UPI001EF8CB2E|nr:polyprenyl synthetase family protein [Vitreimonas flagellata]
MGPAVGPAKQAAGAPHAVDRLAALLADDLAAVDVLIHQHMASPVGVIPNLAAHLIDAGGKRIRPLITLAAARLLGGGGDGARKLATAVEFVHSATLLHDDVVDLSNMRRGKKAANLIWGNSASVLVGDFLFARSFTLMVETGDIQVLDILSRAACVIAEGEVMQLAAANDAETTRERYLDIIAAKTAALFAAAGKAGAVVAGRPGAEASALETYGRELGLAFQLVDDALDYGGLSATMGKNAGDDFREGKVTLPLVFAREAGDESERTFWRRVISGERTDDDFHRAVALIRRHDGIALTLQAARDHAARAKQALEILPTNAYREALADLPDFVVERAY